MERNRQHIIEEESHKKLQLIVPSGWVIRKQVPDYGTDYTVEIFRKGLSTGLMFYIQVKGSDRILEEEFSFSVERKHIEYYNSLTLPVLFVVYSTTQEKFWATWSNAFPDVTEEGKEEQNSFSFQFRRGHIISNQFFVDLENYFTNDMTQKYDIRVSGNNGIASRYH